MVVWRAMGVSVALDFEIDLAMPGERGYPVTVRSPGGGEASATMRLTAEMQALAARVPEAVVASSATVRRGLAAHERPVRDLGGLLFRALVSDDVRSLLLASRQQAALGGQQLRIILRIAPPELACLPWEFLFDPGDDDYLCMSTPLIRRPQVLRPVRALGVTGPLRVLGMVASPGDQQTLAAADERRRLGAAMGPLAGRVNLVWVDGQGWRDLNVALRNDGPWHVLHFIGHGGFDSQAGEGVLMLAAEGGRSHALPASDVALLVEKHPSVRLVVLNACDTGRASALDAFSSVAGALLRRGIPSVLAMQFPITDPAAVEFSRTFYEGMADGLPVDAAVTEARQAVRITLPGTLEWGTPVLYLRSADGVIFDLAQGQPGSPAPRREQGAAGDSAAADALDRLYTEGLAAYYTESWDEAVEAFEAVMAHDRTYRDVGGKLSQARRQQRLTRTYAAALAAAERGAWDDSIDSLTSLLIAEPAYRDAQERLDNARRQRDMAALWAEARGLYKAGEWAAVTAIAEKIAVLDPGFADQDGLIAASRKRLAEQAHADALDRSYRTALSQIDAGQWRQALGTLKGIRQIDAGYRDTSHLIVRVGGEMVLSGEKLLLHTIPVIQHAAYGAFSPDGKVLAVACGTTAQLIDIASGKTQITIAQPGFTMRGVAFSPDGQRLATGNRSGSAIVCDTATGSRRLKVRSNSSISQLQDLAFSPAGRLLATAGEDRTARVWDIASGRLLLTLPHDAVVYHLAFSPDGRRLATASFDRMARVWDVASGKRLLTVTHNREVYGVAFSPDGRVLATCSRDKTARVWDSGTGEQLLAVTHGDAVFGVAFSPDGLMATASADKNARVWDMFTGEQFLALPHDGIVDRAVFSPDGRQLATITRYKYAQVWQIVERGDG